ncbi:MAG: DUF1573 domain-containing protein [Bacteroidota bacterium]
MKITSVIVAVIGLSLLASCSHEGSKKVVKEYASISFTSISKDIGTVVLGTSKELSFYAINKSDTPLIIDSVKSSCSCTVSKFPKKPILKNDSGLIVATYTPNKTNVGYLEKSIVVLSNTKPAFTVLSFSGTVTVE